MVLGYEYRPENSPLALTIPHKTVMCAVAPEDGELLKLFECARHGGRHHQNRYGGSRICQSYVHLLAPQLIMALIRAYQNALERRQNPLVG